MSCFDEIALGDKLSLEKYLSRPQLFRYSAITWNTHRIHYDPEYARTEGHPNILVQAHFHGAAIQELLLDWAGADGHLTQLSWRNVGRAIPENPLHVHATVTDIDTGAGHVEFEVWTISNEDRCAEGTATVTF